MTNPVEQARRAKFEAKFPLPENVEWNDSTKSYIGTGMRSQWWLYQDRLDTWNAALDSVVVELPAWEQYDDDMVSGAATAINDCRDAIRAAGVKTNER